MNATSDTTTADNGGSFDPREAAALLDTTTQRARREFEPSPPWFLATRAVGALIVYGGIWLSVRGQHPYMYPTAAAAPAGIIFGLLNLTSAIALHKRADAGVTRRTQLHPTEIVIMTAVLAGSFIGMAVLASLGVRDSITWGLYPATAPLIAAGLAWAGIVGARGYPRALGSGLAVAAIGALALLAGPAGSWLVAGVGLFLTLLGAAAVIARRQRA